VAVVGFLAAAGRKQYVLRAEEAELRLADAERAREEHARAAGLAERANAAREIHDILAHSLGALVLQLDALDAVLGARRRTKGAPSRSWPGPVPWRRRAQRGQASRGHPARRPPSPKSTRCANWSSHAGVGTLEISERRGRCPGRGHRWRCAARRKKD
jgi:hypothetical protein